jgi:hypothetical protein
MKSKPAILFLPPAPYPLRRHNCHSEAQPELILLFLQRTASVEFMDDLKVV